MTRGYRPNSAVCARGGAGLLGRFAAAAFTGVLAIGCGSPNETEPQGATCSGETPGTDGDIAETGHKLKVACVSFGGYGQPTTSNFRHQIEIKFADNGLVLAAWFHNTIKAPTTLDLATPVPSGEDATFGANLLDYRGFEGGPQTLCNAAPGFPPRAAVSGTVKLDTLTVAQDGFLDAADGEITAQFEGCTIDLWDPLESTCRHASLSIL